MPINVTMPALSPTMTDGTLAKWLKAEGDVVEAGDVIAEIETDKATMEVEAVDEGVIGKILVAAGTQNVPVNDVIAVLLEDGESVDDIGDVSAAPAVAPVAPVPTAAPIAALAPADEVKLDAPKAAPAPVSAPVVESGARVFASPLAKRIAADKGIDLSSITGSGPKGRIVKADVEKVKAGVVSSVATGAAAASMPSDAEFEVIPHNNIKRITAQRLQESKQNVPHFYVTIECRIDTLLAARAEINAKADSAFKLSVNDFIIKANAMALKACPAANVSWGDDAMLQYKHSDISVAVATPNGLITPIVWRAEEKGLRQISEEVKDLAARARGGKLKPEEFQGGTFTISNLGMFGVKEFSAIINPPQSCIMAVGAGEQKPIVDNGEVKIATIMSVTLSTDHRSVDGAVAAEYLQHFKQYIEDPISMLL